MRFLVFIALAIALYYLARKAMASGTGMSAAEAAKTLEIAPDSDAETIVAAHKRLIAKVHPDAGGSAELAARVNRARDILLRQLPR